MKKFSLILVVMLLLGLTLTACGGGSTSETAPVGEALVTVSGMIQNTNSGDTYVLDEAAFDATSVEEVYNDPWMGDGLTYKGILLSDLITLINPTAEATTISLVAVDGMSLDIPISDANQYHIMLAHWVDGEMLANDTGGPVKVAFPDDASGTYTDEQWMWWITTIEVK
jgi:hypothetical protein